MLKRLFDILLSLSGLVVLLPLMALISLLIKIGDKGPVFYRGIRIGREGKPFKMYKFRTMVVDAEKRGGVVAPHDDPRITKVGKILRKYKLDELPQLINVLKGDMSLVGPRPEVPKYVEMFNEEEKAILSIRPGITDWASIWNLDQGATLAGSPDPEKAFEELIRPTKIRLQLKYVREQSLITDLKILVLTILSLILRRSLWKPEEDTKKNSC